MSFPPKPPGFEHGVPRPPGFENVVHRPPGVPCSGCGCFVCGISHNLVFPVRINLVWCPLPTAQPTAQPTAHWPASSLACKWVLRPWLHSPSCSLSVAFNWFTSNFTIWCWSAPRDLKVENSVGWGEEVKIGDLCWKQQGDNRAQEQGERSWQF